MYTLRLSKNGILIALLSIFLAVIIRVFFIDVYKIPSSSMMPTLLPGDFIIVSKMSYGTRLLRPINSIKENKIEFVRLIGWNKIKSGDIFVFNWPRYNKPGVLSDNIFGSVMVKRCYGMPGDSVLIRNEGIINDKWDEGGLENVLFPYDSSLSWSLDNFGPLYVPARGDSIDLTKKNLEWYKDVYLFENSENPPLGSLLRLQRDTMTKYIFRNNYYFMVGDNFYNSQDSRYWGFVPEGNIIGKAVLVLCSFDPNKSGLKKFRWNRLFHSITIQKNDRRD